MKSVIILGSTGSIGRSTLDVIRKSKNNFRIIGLSTCRNTGLLRKQVKEFRPKYVSIFDKERCRKFNNRVSPKLFAGEEGLLELSRTKADLLVLGIGGLAALKPLMFSLGRARRVLLANKEAIISAGEVLLDKMKQSRTEILPVDSEAWAVFNLLKYTEPGDLLNIYITASGGPLLGKNSRQIKNIKKDEVLKHPVWNMGKRISIDSATLMNKGFEVMEISRLFGIPLEKIKVLVHPQSIVHAMLERKDGNLLSCLFFTDMRVPIAASLEYPANPMFVRQLPLHKINRLEFFEPDYKKFPSLELAYFVAKKGESYPSVLVAADEEAVNLYLEGKIGFCNIYELVKKVIDSHRPERVKCLDDIFFWEAWAKDKVRRIASRFGN